MFSPHLFGDSTSRGVFFVHELVRNIFGFWKTLLPPLFWPFWHRCHVAALFSFLCWIFGMAMIYGAEVRIVVWCFLFGRPHTEISVSNSQKLKIFKYENIQRKRWAFSQAQSSFEEDVSDWTPIPEESPTQCGVRVLAVWRCVLLKCERNHSSGMAGQWNICFAGVATKLQRCQCTTQT